MFYSEAIVLLLVTASTTYAFPTTPLHKRQNETEPSTPSSATAGKIPVIWQGGKFRGSFLLGGESPVYLTMDTGSSPFWTRWTGGAPDPNYRKDKSGLYDFTCDASPPQCPTTQGCCADKWKISYGSPSNPDVIQGQYKTYESVGAPAGNFPAGVDMSTYKNDKGVSAFSVPDQAVWLVDTSTRQDAARGAGICGLGFGTAGYSTLWETGKFGYFTSYVPNDVPTDEWFFGFGVDDTTKRSGELSYLPRSKTTGGHWYVDIADKITVGDIDITIKTPLTMLLDTGTPNTVMDREAVEAVYNNLQNGTCPDVGSCTFNCSYYNTPGPDGAVPKMPTIQLPWDGKQTITLNTNPGSFYDASLTTSEKCKGTLQRAALNAAAGVYGTAVYKSAYFLWDGDNAKVGVAPYSTSTSTSTSTSSTTDVHGLLQQLIEATKNLQGSVADAIKNIIDKLKNATTTAPSPLNGGGVDESAPTWEGNERMIIPVETVIGGQEVKDAPPKLEGNERMLAPAGAA